MLCITLSTRTIDGILPNPATFHSWFSLARHVATIRCHSITFSLRSTETLEAILKTKEIES
jgi:hypothetical protein